MFPRCVMILCLAATASAAQVRWTSTEVSLALTSGDVGGSATFEFVNPGNSTVRITHVEPGCSCTVPTLGKTEFAPGERGTIAIQFSVGERRGSYRVPIRVDFADGTRSELNLIAQIRELVKVVPMHVGWANGEKREPREIELHWADGDKVEVNRIRNTNEAFVAEILPATDRNGALVRITPTSESATGVAVVIISTKQGEGGRERNYTIVARAL